MSSIVIDIDECKRLIPGYSPSRAPAYHHESVRIANKAFKEAISNDKPTKVILMCGGSASGKSELVSSKLINEEAIIFDSTLHTIEGAKVKIRNSESKNKKVEVCVLLPDDISKTFDIFLVRDRRVPEQAFYDTHVGCRKTILWLANNRPDIDIVIYNGLTTPDNKLKIVVSSKTNPNTLQCSV